MDFIEKLPLPNRIKDGLYLLVLGSIGVAINAVLPSGLVFVLVILALFLPMFYSLIFLFVAGHELLKAKGYEVLGAIVGAFLVISAVGALGLGYETWGQSFLQGVIIVLSVSVLWFNFKGINWLRHAPAGSGCLLTLMAMQVAVLTPLAALSLAYAWSAGG